MISPELLEILRCPMDPSQTRLTLEEDRLICQRCALVFRIKDGFPVLVVEEAELPLGCKSLSELPCQREPKEALPESAVPIQPFHNRPLKKLSDHE